MIKKIKDFDYSGARFPNFFISRAGMREMDKNAPKSTIYGKLFTLNIWNKMTYEYIPPLEVYW